MTNNDNNEDVIIETPENIEQGGEGPNSDLETMIEIKEEYIINEGGNYAQKM